MDNKEQATPGVSPPGSKQPLTINQLIDSYVTLRDRKRALESKHKEALKPYNDVMGQIEGELLEMIQRQGVQSLSGSGGTAYLSTKPRATIKDGSAFRGYVISNQKFELVDWKANANAVFDFINANNGSPPPGVNASSYTSVNVRRPGEKD